jgi:hypothetical protein
MKTVRLITVLWAIFLVIQIPAQVIKLSYKGKDIKIDSIAVYDEKQKNRLFKLKEFKNPEEPGDTNYYVYVIYFKKHKICILENLNLIKCDTIMINMYSKKYYCKKNRHRSIITYDYCNKWSEFKGEFSLHFPCCTSSE